MKTTQIEKTVSNTKTKELNYTLLALSIIFDLIGMASFLIPGIGEFFDLIWAPISAVLIWQMYRKQYGAIGGVVGFFEEIMPGLDFIPTFTLMWIYKNYFANKR